MRSIPLIIGANPATYSREGADVPVPAGTWRVVRTNVEDTEFAVAMFDVRGSPQGQYDLGEQIQLKAACVIQPIISFKGTEKWVSLFLEC